MLHMNVIMFHPHGMKLSITKLHHMRTNGFLILRNFA